MNLQHRLLLLAAVPGFLAPVACDGAQDGSDQAGAAARTGLAGSPANEVGGRGGTGANGGSAGLGAAGTSGVANGGNTAAGAGGSGIGGALVAGGDFGGGSPGGTSAGGQSFGGTSSAGAGGAAVGAVEDDGADCKLGTLPESASLTTITKLPDPFTKLDGTRIAKKADWRCRRRELRALAEQFAYGTKPPPPAIVSGTVTSSAINVKVTDGGKTTSFSATIKLPSSGSAPYPAIIVYGGAGFGSPLDASVINAEGVALIQYDPYAVGKETGARSPKSGAFYDVYGSNSTTGLLVAWSWGVSRIIDVIAQSDGKDLRAQAVGVTGCSRFGKGAFIAGAFDQRVALTMPVESGSAGVPIWRGISGEGAQSLSSAYGEQPWFGDAFRQFTNAPTKAPLDTHEVVAMIAPRGLFIMDNPHIANLGPKSASVAALAAAEVFKALGAEGNMTYYSDVQDGSHCSLRPEWSAPLRSNIRKFLNGTGADPGVLKISAKAQGKLSDWRDWETPTLD